MNWIYFFFVAPRKNQTVAINRTNTHKKMLSSFSGGGYFCVGEFNHVAMGHICAHPFAFTRPYHTHIQRLRVLLPHKFLFFFFLLTESFILFYYGAEETHKSPWGSPRTPLSLSLSRDGQHLWQRRKVGKAPISCADTAIYLFNLRREKELEMFRHKGNCYLTRSLSVVKHVVPSTLP